MISLKVDKNNNLLASGEIETAQGVGAIAQDIKNYLMMWRSEYPYDVTQGIDYKTFYQTQDKQELLTEITNRIMADSRIISVDYDISNKTQNLQINLKTVLGGVTIELD